MNLFDVVNHLNTSKQDNWEEHQSVYNSFMIDRALSQHLDTVLFASEITQRSIPPKMAYDFYRIAIQPKRKRFGKWSKTETDDVQFIMDAYKVNRHRAQEISKLINKSDRKTIDDIMSTGGK